MKENLKTIHYCWFGGKELPNDVVKYIESWKKFFPDYEIKQWNEENFNIHSCKYIEEAYEEKKWAFVSDYARFWILYNYGGIYFDTDVEVVNSIDDLIEKGPFLGKEISNDINYENCNPGLGMYAVPGMKIYKEVLDSYENQHFINDKGEINLETVVERITKILKKYGYIGNKKIEKIEGIYIYPSEYFSPIDYLSSNKIHLTNNTRLIHHFSATWHTKLEKIILFIERTKEKENSIEYKFRRGISLPFRVVNKVLTFIKRRWKK